MNECVLVCERACGVSGSLFVCTFVSGDSVVYFWLYLVCGL